MLRFSGAKGTERSHPGLTVLAHACCTLSRSSACSQQWDLAASPGSLCPLASLSPLGLSLPLRATQDKIMPSAQRQPCREPKAVTQPLVGPSPNLRPPVITPSSRHLQSPVDSPSFPLSPSCGLSQTSVNFLLDHN